MTDRSAAEQGVGRVLGTQHTTTSAFRVVLNEDDYLQLDDLVVVRTEVPKRGEVRTYKDIAADIGRPGAARAVGRACAANPVSLVVPCHRAVGGGGELTGYRWGVKRKEKLLRREGATVGGREETV